MNIVLSKQTRRNKLTNRKRFLKILQEACYVSGLSGLASEQDELNIIIVNDDKMIEINEQFLQHEGSTDVITFDWLEGEEDFIEEEEAEEGKVMGEIYVCLDTAIRATKEFKTSLAQELILYCVHGMLHLCGLDDHCDEDIRKMRAEEQRVMMHLAANFDIETIIDPLS